MTSGRASRAQAIAPFFQNPLLQTMVMMSLITLGCAKEKDFSDVSRSHAPTSKKDVGTIVKADTYEIVAIKNWALKNGAQVRTVYPAAGIYEVFGSENSLASTFPKNVVSKNQFVTLNKNQDDHAEQNRLEKIKSLRQANSNQPGFDLDSCVKSELTPTANLIPLSHNNHFRNSPIFEVGAGPFIFSGEQSEGRLPEESLEYMWVILGPESSLLHGLVFDSLRVSLTPDIPGEYIVYLFVKDTRGVCDGKAYRLGMTSNQPYRKISHSRSFSFEDSIRFRHLQTINATQAWEKTLGEGVIIAIVDSGVNYNHPDLGTNIWTNKKEIPNNGRDDDGNGLIDDEYGWDFSMGDSRPLDDTGHGTHVAGLAASSVFGVAPRATLMPLKALGVYGNGDHASIAGAIMYAADNGADIINLSLGSGTISPILAQAVSYAELKGSILVAAAGNGDQRGIGYDVDETPIYPSGLTNKSLISVAATTSSGTLTSYSNFGSLGVDVAAPGGSREDGALQSASYVPEKSLYVGMSGTSMATPVVSGVVALMKSVKKFQSPISIKRMVMESGAFHPALYGKVGSQRVVNAAHAVEIVQKKH